MTYIWITNYDRGLTSPGYCAPVTADPGRRGQHFTVRGILFFTDGGMFPRPSGSSPSTNFAPAIVKAVLEI